MARAGTRSYLQGLAAKISESLRIPVQLSTIPYLTRFGLISSFHIGDTPTLLVHRVDFIKALDSANPPTGSLWTRSPRLLVRSGCHQSDLQAGHRPPFIRFASRCDHRLPTYIGKISSDPRA